MTDVLLAESVTVGICDAATSDGATLALLAIDTERRVLRVSKHPQRPIQKLILCHRRCKSNPTDAAKDLVRALSMMPGQRSFSGESCHNGFYIGNNIWGKWFEKRAVYCQQCGYAMSGPEIHHVIIVKSGDDKWDQLMKDQCEMGASWHEGTNYGMTYEFE